MQYIPVRWRGSIVAVVVRETRLTLGRRIGELEHHYISLFDRFAHMIARGTFPFRQDDDQFEDAPRVGDGVIVLDPDLRVPLREPQRGELDAPHGHPFVRGRVRSSSTWTSTSTPPRWPCSRARRSPRRSNTATRRSSCAAIPFLDGDEIAGVVVLARDVTDLRRRDRMLLSKDATIREIHHRVKNNLQTIAALLRLQGRRLESGEARAALEESERRIRAIAIVHETLSRDVADVVQFDDILQPLVKVVQETVATPDTDLRFEVVGDAGLLAR